MRFFQKKCDNSFMGKLRMYTECFLRFEMTQFMHCMFAIVAKHR